MTMRLRRRHRVGFPLASLLLIAAVACASGHARGRSDARILSGPDETTVTVINDDVEELRVSLVEESGMRWPLGSVRGQATKTFSFPVGVPLPATLQVLGVSVALRVPRATSPGVVYRGDRLIARLRSPEGLSSLLKVR